MHSCGCSNELKDFLTIFETRREILTLLENNSAERLKKLPEFLNNIKISVNNTEEVEATLKRIGNINNSVQDEIKQLEAKLFEKKKFNEEMEKTLLLMEIKLNMENCKYARIMDEI